MPDCTALMLSYYFPPRGGSGVQRSLKFARYLSDYGVKPVVITTAKDEITQTADTSLIEEIPEVPVFRASSGERRIRALSNLRLGPLISLTLRPDAHILWRKGVRRLAAEVIPEQDCTVIYASVQPWSAAMIGLELKERFGLPLVVDFRDPWSFSTSLSWISKWHHGADARLEERIFREADAIVTVTPGIVERYKALYPFAADRIHLIYNGFDTNDFTTTRAGQIDADGKLRLGFTGRLYSVDRAARTTGMGGLLRGLRYRNCEIDFTTHSIRYMVEALKKVFAEDETLRAHFEFNLAGDIPRDNVALVESKGLSDCIRFHGLVSHSESVSLISNSDMVFLPMMTESSGERSFNASGKIFEYLHNGKPILAAVPDGDAADLVRTANAGWVVDPRNVDQLSDVLKSMIEAKLRGETSAPSDRKFVKKFERRAQAGELAGLLQAVSASQSS